MIRHYLFILIGGMLGALARFLVSGVVHNAFPKELPYGTIMVNISGCLLVGLLYSIHTHRVSIPADIRTFLFIGFFGAFTTFSTYMLETALLIESSRWAAAAGTFMLQNVLGFAAAVAGIKIGAML